MTTATAACPHCAVPLTPVSARARTGYLIALDQCPRCGGIWCDRWELFPISRAEAERLDPVDVPRLHADSPSPANGGTCPRCRRSLAVFQDPMLPSDALVERCNRCDGMWLNRGTLRRLKARAPDSPPLQPTEAVERLARACGTQPQWSTVSKLDAALAPVSATHDPDELNPPDMKATAAAIVLRALIRLLLGI